MRNRYFVAPIDNCGSLGPDRKDRTWGVFDRLEVDSAGNPKCVLDADKRKDAREECRAYNRNAGKVE